ncbi:LysR family transcriptional regulator [Colwellia echini]|uniref:LysR family transcriptional regulator n=1 Tax=Colwellia echini TaxID=1982103 RepID=A0ABY3N0Z1_9GAMM|nr:LysR family transcriptional regulator [Colwellia echini]TYK67079.1 LysR family transcriptional regulator [Colwellia echini]
MDKLETMKAFVTVAQESAFSKAAGKLNISPQLVSKYVSQLEDKLQIRLLNRTTRKVSLTEAGIEYYQRCQQVLADIDEMEGSLTDLHKNISGLLTISAPMSFGTKHLPKLFAEFQDIHPKLKVELKLTDRKVNIVEEGIDVALRVGKLESSSLIAKKITPINLAIYASPDYLKKHGTPNSPIELQGHTYLKYNNSESSMLFSQFGIEYKKLGLNEKIVTNNGDFLVNAAVYDEGIIIQPTFIAGEAFAAGKLKQILVGYEPAPLALYAVYANRKFLAGKVRTFIDFVSQFYGDVPYWD